MARELIVREARSTISGEHAFKFKHVLIREVAYSGALEERARRAAPRFADWLGERAGDELLEIRAFHLDQAAVCSRSWTAPRRRSSREEAADALDARGPARALARGVPQRAEAAAACRRARADARAALLRGPRRVAARRHDGGDRRDGRGREGGRRCRRGADPGPCADRARRRRALPPRRRPRRAALVTQALEVLADEPPEIRFEPLSIASQIACVARRQRRVRALGEARRSSARAIAGRKDQEAIATQSLATGVRHAARARTRRSRSSSARRARCGERQPSAASATRSRARGSLELVAATTRRRTARYRGARELYAEIGNAMREASMTLMLGRSAFAQGDLDARGEAASRRRARAQGTRRPRPALRGAALARADARRARAARGGRAVRARGARDRRPGGSRLGARRRRSHSAEVRAAQGRDAEAEALSTRRSKGSRSTASARRAAGARQRAEFFRARGRDDEVARYEARRAELASSSTAPIA